MNEPLHSCNDVGTGGDTGAILLVIRESNGVLVPESKTFNDEGLDVPDVIDASPQLALLAKVVDTDEECSLATLAVRKLEIGRRCSL
jgi:hypothetical protein